MSWTGDDGLRNTFSASRLMYAPCAVLINGQSPRCTDYLTRSAAMAASRQRWRRSGRGWHMAAGNHRDIGPGRRLGRQRGREGGASRGSAPQLLEGPAAAAPLPVPALAGRPKQGTRVNRADVGRRISPRPAVIRVSASGPWSRDGGGDRRDRLSGGTSPRQAQCPVTRT